MGDPRRSVPRTDALLADVRLVRAAAVLGRGAVKEAVHDAQRRARSGEIGPEDVADAAVGALPSLLTSMRGVVNATGVLVHTNLGRAPLSAAARAAVDGVAGTTDVEFDLVDGVRARRGRGALDALRAAVPDAGDVHIVNNNAAALALCALALARGREIVIARGELVEIGDGFRIPELLDGCGARLVEVGATNRVHVRDYARAVGPDTGFVLKVHPSNFLVTGFTSAPGIGEIVDAVGPGVPVVADIGSGLLEPHAALPDEPDAATALRAGAALVTASGDKLLGGPQAGLILGAAPLVEALRRHPTARALRVDKLTLAALEATLRGPAPPVRRFLEVRTDELRGRADALVEALVSGAAPVAAEVVDSVAAVGGGGAPGVELASVAVALPEVYAAALRRGDPPVVGRVERGRCLLDLRAVDPADDAAMAGAVRAVAAGAP
jgi:L-seryl-tRNA(Ser) seleniumtransferase